MAVQDSKPEAFCSSDGVAIRYALPVLLKHAEAHSNRSIANSIQRKTIHWDMEIVRVMYILMVLR